MVVSPNKKHGDVMIGYHITIPSRAHRIIEDGFDCELNPNYHTKDLNTVDQRIYFVDEISYLNTWIKILKREQRWSEITIIILDIPDQLTENWTWDLDKPIGYGRWGAGQGFLQVHRPFMNGDLGVYFKILE